MRVVVLGAGGIGSIVAAFAARGGHSVTLVARGDHLRVVRERGLTVTGRASFSVELDAAETAGGVCDLLVVCTKTPDTREAVGAVEDLDPELVFSLQNGVLKDALLAQAFGGRRVVGATTMIGATRSAPGVVDFTLDGATVIGELGGGVSARTRAIERAWNAMGLEMLAVDDVLSHEWSKQALQAAASPLAVATNLPSHLLYLLPPLARSIVGIVREVAAVAAGLGIELSPYAGYGFDMRALAGEAPEDALARVRRRGEELVAAGKTDIILSMLQDVRAGRRTEIDETAGYVVAEAERLGIDVPRLRLACDVVRGISLASAADRVGPDRVDGGDAGDDERAHEVGVEDLQ
jgi:2-dehydropantoate 2-reductase